MFLARTTTHLWPFVSANLAFPKDIGYKVRMSYKRPRDALRGVDVEKAACVVAVGGIG